jgi:hypothetical protein
VKAIKIGGAFPDSTTAASCCRKAGQVERIDGNAVRGKAAAFKLLTRQGRIE